MAKILKTFDNKEDGIQSMVVEGDKGYNVVLRDTDAGENVGIALIYTDLDKAIEKAKSLV